MPYYSSHKIRFFGATELFYAGVEPEQIRRILGHTNLSMTEHSFRQVFYLVQRGATSQKCPQTLVNTGKKRKQVMGIEEILDLKSLVK